MKILGCDAMLAFRSCGYRQWQVPCRTLEPEVTLRMYGSSPFPYEATVVCFNADGHRLVFGAVGTDFEDAETRLESELFRCAPLEVIAWLRGKAETCES